MELRCSLRCCSTAGSGWPDPRVLDREASHDDGHFGTASLVVCFEKHSSELRVDGDRGELSSEWGEPAVGPGPARVDCIEFLQQGDAISDRTGVGGIDERKRRCVAEPQRRHTQDDRREVRSLYFRFGEVGTVRKAGLVVESDADTGPETAASTRSLVGGGLRDVFDRQALDFGTSVEAGDPCGAGVDHGMDAGDGQ